MTNRELASIDFVRYTAVERITGRNEASPGVEVDRLGRPQGTRYGRLGEGRGPRPGRSQPGGGPRVVPQPWNPDELPTRQATRGHYTRKGPDPTFRSGPDGTRIGDTRLASLPDPLYTRGRRQPGRQSATASVRGRRGPRPRGRLRGV